MKISNKVIKIAFVGPSGSGKSTAANYFTRQFVQKYPEWKVVRLNVAAPLHKIQKYSYKVFGLKNTGQDGKLLQFIAGHFSQRLGPTFVANLENCFSKNNKKLLLINSDCRNNAYDYLKKEGFVFIRIKTKLKIRAQRLGLRMDVTPADTRSDVEQIDQIVCQYEIENDGTKNDLELSIIDLIKKLKTKTGL